MITFNCALTSPTASQHRYQAIPTSGLCIAQVTILLSTSGSLGSKGDHKLWSFHALELHLRQAQTHACPQGVTPTADGTVLAQVVPQGAGAPTQAGAAVWNHPLHQTQAGARLLLLPQLTCQPRATPSLLGALLLQTYSGLLLIDSHQHLTSHHVPAQLLLRADASA